MTLSPFSTGCSLSSHLGPSLLSSLLLPSHPSPVCAIPTSTTPPSRAGTAQRPGLDVWTCLRTEHYSAAEPSAGSRPRRPASEASAAIVIGHMGFFFFLGGVVLACPPCLIFWACPSPHREWLWAFWGTDNVSIKSLYILQQRRGRSLLPWSGRSSAVANLCICRSSPVLARRRTSIWIIGVK